MQTVSRMIGSLYHSQMSRQELRHWCQGFSWSTDIWVVGLALPPPQHLNKVCRDPCHCCCRGCPDPEAVTGISRSINVCQLQCTFCELDEPAPSQRRAFFVHVGGPPWSSEVPTLGIEGSPSCLRRLIHPHQTGQSLHGGGARRRWMGSDESPPPDLRHICDPIWENRPYGHTVLFRVMSQNTRPTD